MNIAMLGSHGLCCRNGGPGAHPTVLSIFNPHSLREVIKDILMTNITAVSTSDFRYGSLLTIAKGARESIVQSTLLTAANACNVQILASACVRLSSDSGDMASIINSTDAASTFWESSRQARDLMQATAETAEKASLLVMECSELAAQQDMIGILDRLNTADNHVITPELRSAFAGAWKHARAVAGKSAEVVGSMKSLAVEFARSAGAVCPLAVRLLKMHARGPMISSDLVTASAQLSADTNKTFALLRTAIESTIAADAAVAESAAYSDWIRKVVRP